MDPDPLTPKWRAIRRTLRAPAIVAVCVLAVVAGVEELHTAFLLHSVRPPAGDEDRATRQERRFAELRPLLPDSGVIGYRSVGLRGGRFTSLEAMQDFLVTQYVLAPVIVVPRPDLPLVVGDLGDSVDSSPVGRAPPGYRVLQDLGNGVVLMARER